MADMDLDAAVDELYGLAPEEFLARRTALAATAKRAGDVGLARQITALRKPTVAAWAVNLLARRRPDALDRLSELAARLREAQRSLDGPEMTRLGRERTALVDDLVAATAAAVADAGARLSPAAAAAAASTFVAALATQEATEVVLSGRLTRHLEYAGFGEVDLRDATARPLRLVPAPAPSVLPRSHDGGPPATAAPAVSSHVLAAEAALHAAMSAATAATSRAGVLAAESELAATRVAQLQKELVRARAHRDATDEALAAAEVAREAAEGDLAAARAALEDARAAEG